MAIKAQRGTKDIFADEALTWQKIIETAGELFRCANYSRIITPVFEATELFARGVGGSTDIVNKEMYTFSVGGEDKTSITLRPENTAGIVRAYIEHNISRQSPPQKFWYFGPMFRYERPQAGRQRQFNQIGAELFGVKEASADAEVISLAADFLKKLGLKDLEVEINSLGCKDCREAYRSSIKEAVKANLDELCDDCKMRYEKNPLRMLDCKNEGCQKFFDTPAIQEVIKADYICDECTSHFEDLKKYLNELEVKYSVNKLLVRGLDYYNRSVFEIKSNDLGSQNAVCGGGRYDGLVEMLDGPPTPAVGWAMGVERLYSLIDKAEPQKLDYFIVSDNAAEALKLAQKLRDRGYCADFDMQSRKWGKQLDKASKVAKYAVILGEDELKDLPEGVLTVKNLTTGEQKKEEIL